MLTRRRARAVLVTALAEALLVTAVWLAPGRARGEPDASAVTAAVTARSTIAQSGSSGAS